jgi:hypothetical protein
MTALPQNEQEQLTQLPIWPTRGLPATKHWAWVPSLFFSRKKTASVRTKKNSAVIDKKSHYFVFDMAQHPLINHPWKYFSFKIQYIISLDLIFFVVALFFSSRPFVLYLENQCTIIVIIKGKAKNVVCAPKTKSNNQQKISCIFGMNSINTTMGFFFCMWDGTPSLSSFQHNEWTLVERRRKKHQDIYI